MDLVNCFDPTLFAEDYYVGETDGGTISPTMEHTADWFTEAVQPHVETFSTTDTENLDTELHSHCGVIEFTADEGVVFMPKWMMENMKLQDGEVVNQKMILMLTASIMYWSLQHSSEETESSSSFDETPEASSPSSVTQTPEASSPSSVSKTPEASSPSSVADTTEESPEPSIDGDDSNSVGHEISNLSINDVGYDTMVMSN
nr:fimbrin-1-like [Tanacetum cinerariifolium]